MPDPDDPRQPYWFLAEDYRLTCQAARLSPGTVREYSAAIRRFGTWLAAHDLPTDPAAITREMCVAWQVAALDHYAARSVAVYHVVLAGWFRWLVARGVLAASPWAAVPMPQVVRQLPALLPPDALTRLLAACRTPLGKGAKPGFLEARDLAVVLVLFDTGMRHAELAALALADVTFGARPEIAIRAGKGDKARRVGLGHTAVLALRSYLRARATHPATAEPWLWLCAAHKHAGWRLGYRGLGDVLHRRARQAGLDTRVYPHLLRHGFVDAMLRNLAPETVVISEAGWSERSARDMLALYGASQREQRALDAHATFSPADRLQEQRTNGRSRR